MKILKIVSGLLLAVATAPAQQYVISTVAGIGGNQASYGDGTAANTAGLDMPTRVAVDSKGNFYIVDYLSQYIREVTASTGIINTIVGNGVLGFQGDNGPAIQAEISDIHGIAVDSSGNIYLSDTGNSRVRKVDTSGNINTIAGNGTFGYTGDGAAAVNAELGRPGSLAVDSSGNVYVPDYTYSVVRKISSSGTISTFAGTGTFGYGGDGGPATKASFGAPVAVAVDAAGNVYVSDSNSATIRKITADGNIQTVATNVDAESMAVDAAGNIYYPDYLTNTVKKILPNGTKIAIAGNGSSGYSGDGYLATNGQLNLPFGIALGSGGTIYVADTNNQTIRLLTPVSTPISVVNAGSNLNGAISPGEIVVIYGTGLGPANLVTTQPVKGVYPTQAGGTTVTFDGVPAPILYSSATQVAAVVPYEEVAGVTAQVTVNYQGNSVTGSNPTTSTAPGLFTANGTGSGQVAAVNQDGTLNSPAHPARVGTVVSLYLTGEGRINSGGGDGTLNPTTAPFATPTQLYAVTINNQRAIVTFAGEAPGEIAGLLQMNVQIPQIPAAVLANSPVSVPVVVQFANGLSQTGVTLSVSN